MTRAYLRLDPDLPDHKESYPDGALAAFVLMLCLAEQQPKRGRFKSERLLRVLLGKRGRFLPFLVEKHDLTRRDDGSYYVEGWDEWQEGDVTVPERMARLRARKSVTNGVTPTVTPGVTAPYSGGGGDVAVSNSGGGEPYNGPQTFMHFRPKKPPPTTDESPTSGLWFGKGLHDGRHGEDCAVCHPPKVAP